MREVLAFIAQKQAEFAQLPLFKFMQDRSISPKQRLAFAPCAAPFILAFADLNKYVLRQEPTEDKIRAILNQHSYEDDYHWQWFLEDIDKLGFNSELKLNDSLRFIWSEETKHSRLLAYELYRYLTIQTEPLSQLVILESMEATSSVFSSFAVQIAEELQTITNQEFCYFGHCHIDVENGHHAHTDEVKQFISNIQLKDEVLTQQFELVEKVFELFSEWSYGMLAYAQAYQKAQLYDLDRDEKSVLAIA
ncbi:MAG: hypothetical protein Tsb0014_13640 [Pleurocapsa sp.]